MTQGKEERKAKIKSLTEAVKTVYQMFGNDGQLSIGNLNEVMPHSVRKTDEVGKYFGMAVDGLEGLMKCLSYASFVEEELK